MKIVYFCSAIIPSTSAKAINTIKMCSAMAGLGHNVFLIIPSQSIVTTTNTPDIYSYYGVKQNFKIIKIWTPGIRGSSIIYAILGALKSNKLKPDIIYSRFLRGSYVCSIFKIKLIFEAHGPVTGENNILLFKRILKSKSLIRLVFLSNRLKDYFENKYDIRKNIVVAYNGADDQSESETIKRDDLIKIKGGNNVGYIGNLYKGKGIEIINYLSKKCTQANFHVIGGQVADIEKLKNAGIARENLFFHGYFPPSLVSNFYGLFDILLLPVQEEVSVYGGGIFKQYYSPPIKLFEYMEAGKPIIASNFLDEILIDRKNAILCDPLNYEDWLHALKILLSDQNLRSYVSFNARNDFINKYTWSKRAYSILDKISFA